MNPKSYPAINDITMVIPTKITNIGVYVKLLEYNNIEGLILLSDLSRFRCRSINKLVRIGKQFPACVLSVDIKTNNISLSKKIVTPNEQLLCQQNYLNLKYINNIILLVIRKILLLTQNQKQTQEQTQEQIPDAPTLYKYFIWSINSDANPKIDLIFKILRLASVDFDKAYEFLIPIQNESQMICDTLSEIQPIEQKISYNRPNPLWISVFKDVLKLKFKQSDILLEAVVDIRCVETGGINVIKSALKMGKIIADNYVPIAKIMLIKSPYYSITIKTTDQTKGIHIINLILYEIKDHLEKNMASITVIKFPQIVTNDKFKADHLLSVSESGSESGSESDSETDTKTD